MTHLGKLRSGTGSYLIGIAFALAALGLQWAIHPLIGTRSPFLFFLPVLAVASATLGPGPASIVLITGALNRALGFDPSEGAALSNHSDRILLLAYLAVGLALLLWGGRVRTTSQRAATAEERLRLTQADTGVGLYEVDFETKTVFVSSAMTQLLGRPPTGERISLAQWVSMLPPDEVKKGSEVLKQRLRDGVPGYEREHCIIMPNGQERWLMSRVHIECGADGRAWRVRGASVDITHRKELEAMLHQARDDLTMQVADLQRLHELSSELLELSTLHEQLQAILMALADFHGTRKGLLSIVAPNERRLMVNASLGFSARACERLMQLRGDESPCAAAVAQRQRVVVEDTERDSGASRFKSFAFEEAFRAVHSTPLLTSSGDVLGVISVHFVHPRRPSDREMRLADICARKAAVFVERARAVDALRVADRRKDEFLATLAHELRNPLAPIRQAAVISKSPIATEAQKRWSHDVIERQVRQMALLLDDLLDVSRITRGMLQLRKSATDVGTLIDAAVETVQPLIDARQHRLEIDIPSEPLRLEADPLRIAQVLANLLANAAKYTDAGGIIEVWARAEGDEIEVRVSDNGIGMSQETLPAIFEMFTQVRSGEDRSAGGLGIGLALARGLAGLHGGSIVATSPGAGAGSTFILRLPIGAVPADRRDAPIQPHVSTMVARRVLVADDNRDATLSLAELLRMDGHEVAVAFDGEEALSEFARFEPEVVLLDIGMPKLDGNAVADAIRKSAAGQHTMLVAITGWGQEKDRSQALAAGFDHHLTKPVDPERVFQLLAVSNARTHAVT
jgi:PAS domain S-box-containing protein